MTSGIYKLTFPNGQYYIGKSNNIERRWKEHWTKFQKGTAAVNMQLAFDMSGYPKQEILYVVHPEHIDVIEPIAIDMYWGPNILNKTKEACATDMEDDYLRLCQLSLGNLCLNILEQEKQIDQLRAELEEETDNFNEILEDIKDGTALKKAESMAAHWKKQWFIKNAEIDRLKKRTFLQRLFDL